jgi:hypothetical protein
MVTDSNGYERGEYKHSDLIHRQVAYNEIYKKNKKKYPLKFSEYIVHHVDGDKKNNIPSNLQIMTQKEHEKVHGIYSSNSKPKEKALFDFEENARRTEKEESIKYPKNEKYDLPPIKITKPSFNVSENRNKRKKTNKSWNNKNEDKDDNYQNSKKKTSFWFWIILILLVSGLALYPKIKDRVEMKNWADLPTTNPVDNSPKPIVCTADAKQCPDGSYVSRIAPDCNFASCPPLPDYKVEGTKTEVVIQNNLAEDISLNVTYRIFSNFFGKDSTENQVFEVGANSTETFKVYYNDGCSSSPCSVSIIKEERIE